MIEFFINAICIITIIILCSFLFLFVTKIIKFDSKKRINYLKSFRKGKIALIYLLCIPIYFIGFYYEKNDFLSAFFFALKSSVESVVLKFNYEAIWTLATNNFLYGVTCFFTFLMIILNTLIFSFTIFGISFTNFVKRKIAFWGRKDIIIIVGYNSQNFSIVKSVNKKIKIVMLCDYDDLMREKIYLSRAIYYKFSSTDKLDDSILNEIKYRENKKIKIIINTTDDVINLILTKQINDAINKSSNLISSLTSYTFVNPENKSAFAHFIENGKGVIRCTDKYSLQTLDFIDRFPLTIFMNDEIDYSTGEIKENVKLNVVHIGFGATSQEILLKSIVNNQFVAKGKNHNVNYYIYDKENVDNDKNLNHNYFRFQRETIRINSESLKEDYFELPDSPANLFFNKLNINDGSFYANIFKNITTPDKKNFTYIIVSYGTDMENFDLAEKLYMKAKEWDIISDTIIFTKIRSNELTEAIKSEFSNYVNFYLFGDESKTVYNYNKIFHEKIQNLAMYRHIWYTSEKYPTVNIAEIEKIAYEKWFYEWSYVQRESNIFSCLSIKFKLNLLGFDYIPATEDGEDASKEFFKKYNEGNPIKYFDQTFENKHLIDYSNINYDINHIRTFLAFQEHQRWNAYMIVNGFVPAKKKDIEKYTKKELFDLRRHINLTTFDGLKEYKKYLIEQHNTDPNDADVIKYDFQLMDDVLWLLKDNDYKIVKKNN